MRPEAAITSNFFKDIRVKARFKEVKAKDRVREQQLVMVIFSTQISLTHRNRPRRRTSNRICWPLID